MIPETYTERSAHPVTRLTALWALNECGLGGLMFALRIPLTGFFVGGFAVMLIGLIAYYSDNDYRKMINALVIVLIAKAAASPHSPPPAYLAVAFQGLCGALLYRIIPHFRTASLLLAVLAMVESALQKLLLLTLIYGQSIWIALDRLYEGIVKEFSLRLSFSFSYMLIGIYLLAYVLWGILIGLYAARLPLLIGQYKDQVLQYFREHAQHAEIVAVPVRGKRYAAFLAPVLILLFILLVFFFGDQYKDHKLLYIALRSTAAFFLLFFVLRPLVSRLIQRWLRRRDERTRNQAAEVMAMMPGIRRFVRPSWQFAGNMARGSGRLRYFTLSLIILSLNEK